jgi:beta-glucosidase
MAGGGFPKGFLWGAATAAYQVEGAVNEDGRGESIWDRFCRTPGAVNGGDTGDTACDHYHRWREDVDAMQRLGLNAYRFSTAWPRILPKGRGRPNARGLDFYESLVDALLAAGIAPALTLYHWDLPQPLQDAGGWTSRDTARWFADYTAAVIRRLGDRVPTWMTINEPWVAAFVGHLYGTHAPGGRDFAAAVQAAHELLRAHGLAVEAFRELAPSGARVGIALDLHPTWPWSDSGSDSDAALRADGFNNRWFLDPVLRGAYPRDMEELYARAGVAPRVEEGDLSPTPARRVDFLGVNYYAPHRVAASAAERILGFEHRRLDEAAHTQMDWEVHPEGLEELLTRLQREYDNPLLLITENGAAYPDTVTGTGEIDDDDRVEYLAGHLGAARRAVERGVRLQGYFLWSLMDNFEWGFGYSRRFGIVHVDFATMARTWKKSAHWYQRVIAENGAGL